MVLVVSVGFIGRCDSSLEVFGDDPSLEAIGDDPSFEVFGEGVFCTRELVRGRGLGAEDFSRRWTTRGAVVCAWAAKAAELWPVGRSLRGDDEGETLVGGLEDD